MIKRIIIKWLGIDAISKDVKSNACRIEKVEKDVIHFKYQIKGFQRNIDYIRNKASKN
jgi:hypothetical protein